MFESIRIKNEIQQMSRQDFLHNQEEITDQICSIMEAYKRLELQGATEVMTKFFLINPLISTLCKLWSYPDGRWVFYAGATLKIKDFAIRLL